MQNYTTQMDAARKGIVTKEMEIVAQKEYRTTEEIRQLVAEGKVAIPANKHHTCLNPEGIGSMLRTKINVNLGVSRDCKDYNIEMQKVMSAVNMGAEAIMDLSSHGNTQPFRQKLTHECPVMIGTVPVYDSVIHYQRDLATLTAQDFVDVVRLHAEDGVDFVIVCLHHGEEYQDKHNDKDQTRFARHAIDSGADLVVGTHPHVLQGIEVYKNRLIFYSLGNFVFGGNKNPLSDKKTAKQIPTALMSVELQFDQNQLYSTQFTIHPYYETGDEQINNYQPVPVTGDKAQRVMDILQSDTPFTLNPFIEGEGAVQDIIYANDQH